MREMFNISKVVGFGEIYSPNVGDGIIFECLQRGMLKRGVEVIPADLSLRDGYGAHRVNKTPIDVGVPRRLARYFVRRSLFLRRMITLAKWNLSGRTRFIDRYNEAIRQSDGIIIGGGQILVDRQLYFPLVISAILDMARNANKPVAVFSCGMDTKQGWIARRIFRRMAQEAVYISVRDQMSAQALQALDKNTTVNVHPDIGFLTGRVYPLLQSKPGRILGINVMPYETVAAFSKGARNVSRSDYVEFWRNLIQSAANQGWKVHVLTNGDLDDVSAAKEIYGPFAQDERINLGIPPANPATLVEMLQGIDAIITSRMHAGIVAYSLGKKVLPLVWDAKVSGVWLEADPNVDVVSFDNLFKENFDIIRLLENPCLVLNLDKEYSKYCNIDSYRKIEYSFDLLLNKLSIKS